MKRLAIVTTHPIQYNAPLFKMLAKRNNVQIKVFYTWGEAAINKYDPGFGKNVEWDIPLLEGYEYCFVKNISAAPGSHHFMGINNPDLINDIKNWKADAILVYGWSFKSHLKCLRHFHKKIPVFFRGDSTLLHKQSGIKKMLRKVFLKWVYTYIDKALYVGTHNKNYFLAYGLKPAQLIFAPHAVNNEWFKMVIAKNGNAIQSWKKELGIKETEIVFLYAGKLDHNKNTQLLINAFIKTDASKIQLIIAGNGLLENELKNYCAAYKNIHFLPFQNQTKMPLLYSLCDVFVLPSKTETWGLGINEAMACAKAVLVSNGCGAAADLVKNGINGQVFISNNEADLEGKIKLLATDKNSLQQMGIASACIIKDWNYEKGCSVIEKLMQ